MPVKQLLRAINLIYGDKMAAGREVATVRAQSLAAFIYDSYINKYGLLNVAERKLKEILLATAVNRQKHLKIELFSRFLGLSEVRYTPDDLYFMFTMALQLLQKYRFVHG